VRGHAGHPANERADQLAQEAALHAEPRRDAELGTEQLGFDV
jgi:ribonuclease HI